jgi:hypothetical protein
VEHAHCCQDGQAKIACHCMIITIIYLSTHQFTFLFLCCVQICPGGFLKPNDFKLGFRTVYTILEMGTDGSVRNFIVFLVCLMLCLMLCLVVFSQGIAGKLTRARLIKRIRRLVRVEFAFSLSHKLWP